MTPSGFFNNGEAKAAHQTSIEDLIVHITRNHQRRPAVPSGNSSVQKHAHKTQSVRKSGIANDPFEPANNPSNIGWVAKTVVRESGDSCARHDGHELCILRWTDSLMVFRLG